MPHSLATDRRTTSLVLMLMLMMMMMTMMLVVVVQLTYSFDHSTPKTSPFYKSFPSFRHEDKRHGLHLGELLGGSYGSSR